MVSTNDDDYYEDSDARCAGYDVLCMRGDMPQCMLLRAKR